MKYTLLVTQRCNFACDYCYIGKRPERMSPEVARRVVDFAFRRTPPAERVEFGFFGGEPLLELGLMREITGLIEAHSAFDAARVTLGVVSNGSIFSSEIADFLIAHGISLGISCDGPPEIQNRHRRFRNGRGSALHVERTIRSALEALPGVMVNAVYGPDTLSDLPRTIEYLHLDLVQSFIKEKKVQPVTEENLPFQGLSQILAGLLPMQPMSASAQPAETRAFRPPRFDGGMRVPHLHLGDKVYKLTSDQWKEFSGNILRDFSAKLGTAKTVSFSRLMELSTVVDSMS